MKDKIDISKAWVTDVFFSTGEKSGDLLAAEVYKELYNFYPLKLRAAALGSPHLNDTRITNLLKRPDLALVGLVPNKYTEWEQIFSALQEELRLNPTKVFVGVTHHMFNLPIVADIGDRTVKILVSPPEIWAWQLSFLGKAAYCLSRIFKEIKWLKHAPIHTLRRQLHTYISVFCIAAVRGKLALQNFDTLVFLNPICQNAYGKYRKRYKSKAEFILVGHPSSTYSRTDFKEKAHLFREQNMVPKQAHILGIFPGSREASIERILPTTLEVAINMLKKHDNLCCIVSVADKCFAQYIGKQLALYCKQLDSPFRLSASDVDSKILLSASSHALLSSGTITLEAACLGVPGTVVYDLPKGTKFLKLFAKRQKIGTVKRYPVPFALPNAILAWMDIPQERWPYQEFVLSRKSFEAIRISTSVDKHLCRLSPSFLEDDPPQIDAEIIKIVKTAYSPPSESNSPPSKPRTPQWLIAKQIASHIDEVMRTKNVR